MQKTFPGPIVNMRILLIILSFLFTSYSFGQSASFKEIKIKPKTERYTAKEFTIKYPVIVTKNSKVDELINAQVKDKMLDLGQEDDTMRLKNALDYHISDLGLTDLSYTVTYNKSGLLSFFIFAQGCGAYCSSWRTYFNFDLATGKQIAINDLFLSNNLESFKNIVQKKKVKILSDYKSEQKQDYKNGVGDTSIYDWVITEIDKCLESISIDKFSISDKHLQIIDDCEFPHAIQSQQPTIELHYSYTSIAEFLNPRFARLLK